MPLLNSTCKSLALSLPATIRLDYSTMKQELLALVSAQTEQASKLFWERKKQLGNTWREEVAIFTKLLRRCAPGPTAEEVRGQIVEKLTQMLPKHIQAFVRERKPHSPSEAVDIISTYLRAHYSLIETEWELKGKEHFKKNGKNTYSSKQP